jgi:hypothetical protein
LFSLYLAHPNNAGPCGHHRVQGVPVQVCRYLYRYLWSNLGSEPISHPLSSRPRENIHPVTAARPVEVVLHGGGAASESVAGLSLLGSAVAAITSSSTSPSPGQRYDSDSPGSPSPSMSCDYEAESSAKVCLIGGLMDSCTSLSYAPPSAAFSL